MKIAVDFRIGKDFSPSIATFFEQLWLVMAVSHPAAQFLFIADDEVVPDDLPGNISTKLFKRKGIAWLQQKKLLKTLNEWHAGTYITLHEQGLSLMKPSNPYFTKQDLLRPFARLAFSVFHSSRFPALSSDIETISVVKPAFDIVVDSISWAEAESIKTQYSGGRDFFLFTGDLDEKHQLIELLKAFSVFKKWQQSNMQLLIAGYPVKWTSWFEEKLSTYKYKNDVVMLTNTGFDEIAKLTAVSYALLYPGATNHPPLSLILAIQSGSAFVATDNAVNRQFTNAALWVDNANTEKGFANAMQVLYKDENQKQMLIQKVKDETKGFNRQQMLEEIWQFIIQE
jgi:glycosyltransferase involved in cell wall biosynthesis